MRGQKLYVRPIEAADHDAIRAFLALNAPSHAPVPSCGLLGKLLGDIVAVLSMEITPDAVRVDDLVVAKDLRRKRIGSRSPCQNHLTPKTTRISSIRLPIWTRFGMRSEAR